MDSSREKGDQDTTGKSVFEVSESLKWGGPEPIPPTQSEVNLPPLVELNRIGEQKMQGAQNPIIVLENDRSYAPIIGMVGSPPGSGQVGLVSTFVDAPTPTASP